jgi:hypothetical protein
MLESVSFDGATKFTNKWKQSVPQYDKKQTSIQPWDDALAQKIESVPTRWLACRIEGWWAWVLIHPSPCYVLQRSTLEAKVF